LRIVGIVTPVIWDGNSLIQGGIAIGAPGNTGIAYSYIPAYYASACRPLSWIFFYNIRPAKRFYKISIYTGCRFYSGKREIPFSAQADISMPVS
jgi:hypothetical protein